MDIETVVETGTGVSLTCERDELVRRLAIVSRALSTRTTVQVLSGILLEAEGDRLTLAATDMELSLRSSLDAQVESDGARRRARPAARRDRRPAAGGDVSFAHRPEEGIVELSSGTASYRLHTLSAEDFPRLPEVTAAQSCTRSTPTRWGALRRRSSRAASRDESRPALTGVLVRFEGGKLVDGRDRLVPDVGHARRRSRGAAPDLEAIVPARALARSRASLPAPVSSSSACTTTSLSSRAGGRVR